jgi:hypothetical protein
LREVIAEGVVTRATRGSGKKRVRLAIGGILLPTAFDGRTQAVAALEGSSAVQRCVCGRAHHGDYVPCAGGPGGRCGGFVHARCVGLVGDAPEGYLCPLCAPGPAASLCVRENEACPLVGRVLLRAPGDDDDDDDAPLLLRAVGASTRDGDVVVRCASLVLEDTMLYDISIDDARTSALRREAAEEAALDAGFEKGGKYVFKSNLPNCGTCKNCKDKPEFGGPNTSHRACEKILAQRNPALLALASGTPPADGCSWTATGGIDGSEPRKKRFGSRCASAFDSDSSGSDEERRSFAVGDAVVAPSEGVYYRATVTRVRKRPKRTVDVVFADGGTRTAVPVARIRETDSDDESSAESSSDESSDDDSSDDAPPPPAAKAAPPPAAKAAPPPPANHGQCMICLSQIGGGDAHALDCDHVFHADCLKSLANCVRLATATRRSAVVACPLCRRVKRTEMDMT